MMRRVPGWMTVCATALSALAAMACSEHHGGATGLMVVVDAEPAVLNAAVGMRFVVRKGADPEPVFVQTYGEATMDLIWPRTFSLSPHDRNDNAPLEITATALNRLGAELARARAITRYLPGDVKRLTLLIEDDCIGLTCDAHQTCHDATCFDATIDPHDLPNYEPDPDGGPLPDGGGSDAASGECREVDDAVCPRVCVETCNGLDDDCDGEVDNNGASGACGLANAEAICSDGECQLIGCQGAFADCNGDSADGCEASLASITSCGACDFACAFPNAAARCLQGTCIAGVCDEGFGNCDGDPRTGCETSLRTLNTCGLCTTPCEVGDHALPTCDFGECAIAQCVGFYADCDGDISNGCEQGLDDPDNCGGCGVDCGALPNAVATCGDTGCEGVVCTGAFHDCDGVADNGCEALLNEPPNCGACGNACDLPNAAVHGCDAGGSTATCTIDSTGDNDGCDAGFADCNGDAVDGCERALTSATDCGACGVPCAIDHAVATCVSGQCELVSCAPGFADCDGDDQCESVLNDASNCGECDNACAGSTPNCSGGRCQVIACPSGEADCDDNDTCEPLNTSNDCGGCGITCPAGLPHATGSCASGSCLATCATGFASCNGDAFDGCEVDVRTNSHCGSCGVTCSIANATATCATGSCRVAECSSSHRDCNIDGLTCETSTQLPTSCGSCGNDCTGKAHSTGAGCSNGACQLTCESGYRDCDALATNGCEVSINTPSACGSCGNNCAQLAHTAGATCGGSGCQINECDAGWDDCDGLPNNGCERAINTASDCGGCNVACHRANAATTCSSAGVCAMGDCNPGFGNCNNNAGDGCETQLNSTSNCGMCGAGCDAGEVCNNGTCGPASCPSGQSRCGGSTCVDVRGSCPPWPTCINAKPDNANCGGCGVTCSVFPNCCL